MSDSLRDLALNHLNEALVLMEIGQSNEAWEKLEKAEKASLNAEAYDIFLYSQTKKGHLMQILGAYEEALEIYSFSLKFTEDLLLRDPDNESYKSIYKMNLDAVGSLGSISYNIGLFLHAKKCYELYLSVSQKLLNNDPEDLTYQLNVAMVLNELGILLKDMSRMEEAKEKYKTALDIYEKLLKIYPGNFSYQSHVGIMLNNLGNLLFDMGSIEEAKGKFEKSLEIREKLLESNPENPFYQSSLAMTLNNLGNLLFNTELPVEAKIRYEKSLDIREKLLEEDPENLTYQLHVGTTLTNLGNLLSIKGRTEEAKERYEKALDLREKLLKKYPENVLYRSYVGQLLNDLGELFFNIGYLEEAKIRCEKSLDIREKLLEEDPENLTYQLHVGTTLTNLGNLLSIKGRIEEAKERYEKALDLREKLLKNDPKKITYQSYLGAVLNDLGVLLYNMGHIEEAKQKYENSLEIRKKVLEEDLENLTYQSNVAMTHNNLGLLLSDAGLFNDAKKEYLEALNLREKLLKKDPENILYQSYVGGTLNNLGLLFSMMGDINRAEHKYRKSLEIYSNLLQEYPEKLEYQSDLAMTLNNLGMVLSNVRESEAKKKYLKALKIRNKLLKKDPENILYQSYVGGTLNNLGRLLYSEGNYPVALKLGSKAHMYALNSSNLDLLYKSYDLMGRCYEKLRMYKDAFTNYEEAIKCVESIRSQYLIEEIKMNVMWNKGVVYSAIISLLCTRINNPEKAWEYLGRFKSRTLIDSLRFLELNTPTPLNVPEELIAQEKDLLSSIKYFDKLIRRTEKADEVTRLNMCIKEKEVDLNEVYNKIREFSSEYVDLRRGRPLGIKEIKNLIGSQEKKTAFVEYFITTGKIFIFFMKSDEKAAKLKIVDFQEIDLRIHISKYLNEFIKNDSRIEESWIEFSRYFIDPIFKDIEDSELVYLIPYGWLHYLPIHAFFAENKPLIEHFPIVYLPNLTVLKYSQRKTPRMFESCLSIGYASSKYEKNLLEGEAKLVAKLFNVEPEIGSKATSKILENANHDLIHIACHGGFDRENSLNSGLKLADKTLKVKDIFNLELNTDLLVLSACETGLNEQKPGDELVGLTRALLYAGARSLIVSLWPLKSGSTFEFIERFYRRIKDENMDKAKALQQTQIEFIHKEQHSDPYLWAPFILIGDWK